MQLTGCFFHLCSVCGKDFGDMYNNSILCLMIYWHQEPEVAWWYSVSSSVGHNVSPKRNVLQRICTITQQTLGLEIGSPNSTNGLLGATTVLIPSFLYSCSLSIRDTIPCIQVIGSVHINAYTVYPTMPGAASYMSNLAASSIHAFPQFYQASQLFLNNE